MVPKGPKFQSKKKGNNRYIGKSGGVALIKKLIERKLIGATPVSSSRIRRRGILDTWGRIL